MAQNRGSFDCAPADSEQMRIENRCGRSAQDDNFISGKMRI
jgi:hypothetical protein